MATFIIKGREVSVDDADAHLIIDLAWTLTHSGRGKVYLKRVVGTRKNHTSFYFHRFILGVTDPKIQVDHIDGNGLNNRRDNLRLCSHSENCRNQKIKRNNTSGFKGVRFDRKRNKWISEITRDYRKIYIGQFDNPELAHEAYCEAAKKYHGEFARFD